MLGSSIRLGKIAGVEVGINYSLLFIAVLVTSQLAGAILPSQAPGYHQAAYIVAGLFGAVLFFGSVLWHELAHALMAQFFGIRVRRIVLFFLGGIAEIEDEPQRAYQEFWIAIVGPLSSLLLGGIFIASRLVLGSLGVVAEMLFWLGGINALLAGFNMVPAFPLDGGRVLRAILWGLSGSYLRATRQASYLGRGFAYLMIFGSLASLFAPGLFVGNALWTMLLGLFLLNATKGHLQSAQVRAALSGVRIGELARDLKVLQADWPLAVAVDKMSIGVPSPAAPVVRGEELVGILSVENFRVLPHAVWGNFRVESVMTPISQVQTVDSEQDLYRAMQDRDLSRQPYLVVMSDQQYVGLVSHRDIVNFAERQLRSS